MTILLLDMEKENRVIWGYGKDYKEKINAAQNH